MPGEVTVSNFNVPSSARIIVHTVYAPSTLTWEEEYWKLHARYEELVEENSALKARLASREQQAQKHIE